eukprot:scaffold22752_cov52-Phaeocystis_antarctica.AAC.8
MVGEIVAQGPGQQRPCMRPCGPIARTASGASASVGPLPSDGLDASHSPQSPPEAGLCRGGVGSRSLMTRLLY